MLSCSSWKWKFSAFKNTPTKKIKNASLRLEENIHKIYVTKYWNPKYTKDSSNSMLRKQAN